MILEVVENPEAIVHLLRVPGRLADACDTAVHSIENSAAPTKASASSAVTSAVVSNLPFDYYGSLHGMEDLLVSLYEGLPRLQSELEGMTSADNIIACAVDAACTARVLTAVAQTKLQLATLGEQLTQARLHSLLPTPLATHSTVTTDIWFLRLLLTILVASHRIAFYPTLHHMTHTTPHHPQLHGSPIPHHTTPSHRIPSHSVPSHPIPPHPVPSLIPSHPILTSSHQAPKMIETVEAAVWSMVVNSDGSKMLGDLFDVGTTWARLLSMGPSSLTFVEQLTLAWCGEATLLRSLGQTVERPGWTSGDCEELQATFDAEAEAGRRLTAETDSDNIDAALSTEVSTGVGPLDSILRAVQASPVLMGMMKSVLQGLVSSRGQQ